jgi:hypothetical protein
MKYIKKFEALHIIDDYEKNNLEDMFLYLIDNKAVENIDLYATERDSFPIRYIIRIFFNDNIVSYVDHLNKSFDDLLKSMKDKGYTKIVFTVDDNLMNNSPIRPFESYQSSYLFEQFLLCIRRSIKNKSFGMPPLNNTSVKIIFIK